MVQTWVPVATTAAAAEAQAGNSLSCRCWMNEERPGSCTEIGSDAETKGMKNDIAVKRGYQPTLWFRRREGDTIVERSLHSMLFAAYCTQYRIEEQTPALQEIEAVTSL